MQTGQLDYQQERFDLAVLVRETAEQLQAVTPHHRLSVEGASPAPVMGDRDRIGQVLINLLTNAIKYSPQADNVLVRVAKDQRQVTISVQDFGMGIAKEHHEKIFERFYQVSHPGQHPFSGLGIGLYLASEIIKRHAGRIWVESSKGQGATFSFTLPLTQEAQSSGLLGEGGCQGEGCV
jgi:signal transduction histidine kinase